MNNKGFTLIELLAVLAVMITILLIAIPSISSSIERNKDKFDKEKKELIETAAEVYSDLYLSDNSGFNSGECGINVMRLVDAELIDYETTIMDDGNSLKDLCVYYKNNNYTIIDCTCEVGD